VAAKNDIIITMVPDGPEVEQAVLGPNGVLEGARQGSTVIDMSSISPMVSQKVRNPRTCTWGDWREMRFCLVK